MRYLGRYSGNKDWHVVEINQTYHAVVQKNSNQTSFQYHANPSDGYWIAFAKNFHASVPDWEPGPSYLREEIILTAWPMVEDVS